SSGRSAGVTSSAVPPVMNAATADAGPAGTKTYHDWDRIPGSRCIRLCWWGAEAVSPFRGGERLPETVGDFGQHGRIPFRPFGNHAVEQRLAPMLQVGPLARVVGDIEQKGVVADLEILEIAASHGLLRVRLVPPEQGAGLSFALAGQDRQQADAIRRVVRIGHSPSRF